MWELDSEESWALKNWCFWTVVLEKTLESPLDCKEVHPVHSKGDQSWVFIGRTNAKAGTPVLWPPHAKSWLIGKGSDAGRDWGQEEKGMIEDEMVGWHHWLDGHKFGWSPGVGGGQGGLVCCNSWGHKELDTTERLNWTKLKSMIKLTVNRSMSSSLGILYFGCLWKIYMEKYSFDSWKVKKVGNRKIDWQQMLKQGYLHVCEMHLSWKHRSWGVCPMKIGTERWAACMKLWGTLTSRGKQQKGNQSKCWK